LIADSLRYVVMMKDFILVDFRYGLVLGLGRQ
jgi:hypothetical protein